MEPVEAVAWRVLVSEQPERSVVAEWGRGRYPGVGERACGFEQRARAIVAVELRVGRGARRTLAAQQRLARGLVANELGPRV